MWHKNIIEKVNPLSRVNERHRQTIDRGHTTDERLVPQGERNVILCLCLCLEFERAIKRAIVYIVYILVMKTVMNFLYSTSKLRCGRNNKRCDRRTLMSCMQCSTVCWLSTLTYSPRECPVKRQTIQHRSTSPVQSSLQLHNTHRQQADVMSTAMCALHEQFTQLDAASRLP